MNVFLDSHRTLQKKSILLYHHFKNSVKNIELAKFKSWNPNHGLFNPMKELPKGKFNLSGKSDQDGRNADTYINLCHI
jgi:hypothetical protein